MPANARLAEQLREGWTFDLLYPLFRQKLVKSLSLKVESADKKPTFLLSACRYQVLKPSELNENSDSIDLYTKCVRVINKNLNMASDKVVNCKELTWFVNDLNNLFRRDERTSYFFDLIINKILLVDGSDFSAASSPKIFGLEVITPQYLKMAQEDRLVSMVHELAHQELFLVNLVDRLVNPEFDHNNIYAPFQGRERPPMGRLHALHALYRLKWFGDRTQWRIINAVENKLGSMVDSFGSGEELTEFGRVLLNDVYSTTH